MKEEKSIYFLLFPFIQTAIMFLSAGFTHPSQALSPPLLNTPAVPPVPPDGPVITPGTPIIVPAPHITPASLEGVYNDARHTPATLNNHNTPTSHTRPSGVSVYTFPATNHTLNVGHDGVQGHHTPSHTAHDLESSQNRSHIPSLGPQNVQSDPETLPNDPTWIRQPRRTRKSSASRRRSGRRRTSSQIPVDTSIPFSVAPQPVKDTPEVVLARKNFLRTYERIRQSLRNSSRVSYTTGGSSLRDFDSFFPQHRQEPTDASHSHFDLPGTTQHSQNGRRDHHEHSRKSHHPQKNDKSDYDILNRTRDPHHDHRRQHDDSSITCNILQNDPRTHDDQHNAIHDSTRNHSRAHDLTPAHPGPPELQELFQSLTKLFTLFKDFKRSHPEVESEVQTQLLELPLFQELFSHHQDTHTHHQDTDTHHQDTDTHHQTPHTQQESERDQLSNQTRSDISTLIVTSHLELPFSMFPDPILEPEYFLPSITPDFHLVNSLEPSLPPDPFIQSIQPLWTNRSGGTCYEIVLLEPENDDDDDDDNNDDDDDSSLSSVPESVISSSSSSLPIPSLVSDPPVSISSPSLKSIPAIPPSLLHPTVLSPLPSSPPTTTNITSQPKPTTTTTTNTTTTATPPPTTTPPFLFTPPSILLRKYYIAPILREDRPISGSKKVKLPPHFRIPQWPSLHPGR